jgi:hypothetical protein
MIQTVDQYVFLYRALNEGIVTMNTYVSLQEFIITRKLPVDIKDQYKVRRIIKKNREKEIFFCLNSY